MTGEAPLTPEELDVLDRGLARAAEALDREIAASGAADRVVEQVAARVSRRAPGAVWFAIAAALIVAAGLGSLADLVFFGTRPDPAQEVVVLDPLVFGTTVVDQQ